MRKSVTKIVKAVLGFTMAIGAGVGAAFSSPNANPVLAATGSHSIGWGSSGTDETYDATSGTVTFAAGHTATFTSSKNSSGNNPAYNSSNKELRLYYASNGSGGSVTFSCNNVTITGAVITTSNNSPTMKYSVNGGATSSISKVDGVYTIDSISASTSLMIQNGNTTNVQLQIRTIEFSYSYSDAAPTYKVTYFDDFADSGSVPTDAVTYSLNGEVTVLGNTGGLTKENYVFVGWNDGSTTYEAGDTFNISSNTTLTAVWDYYHHYDDDALNGKITWDLSAPEYVAASETQMSWNSPKATMVADKAGAGTSTNNFCPPAESSTRFYKNGTLTVTPASGYQINRVEFNATTTSYASALSGSSWTNASASVNSTLVTVIPTEKWSAFSVVFGNTTGITSVVVYYAIASTEPSADLSDNSVGLKTNQNEGTTVTVTTDNIVSPSFVWSTADANITLEDTTSATVTIKPDTNVAGSATVTVRVDGTNGGNPIETIVLNVTVTISVPDPGETAGTAYTVAQASAAIAASANNITNVYITGKISQIDEVSTTYHNATYWISDDGTKTNQFKIFHGKYLNNANFTSEDQLYLGDTVIVYGTLSKQYSNFDSGNYIVSLTPAPRVTSVTLTPSSINVAPGASGTINSLFTNIVINQEDGSNKTASDIVWASGDENVFCVLDGNQYIAGDTHKSSTTIYASINERVCGSVTIKVIDPSIHTIDYQTTSWQKLTSISAGDQVVFVGEKDSVKKELTGIESIGTVADYATNPNGNYLLTVVAGSEDNSFAFKTPDDTYISWSSGNSLSTSDSISASSSWTISASDNGNFKLANVGTPARLLQFNSGSPRFACYTSAQSTFEIYKKTKQNSSVDLLGFAPVSTAYDDGNEAYVRLGITLSEDDWDAIDTALGITGYGVMLLRETTLEGAGFNSIEEVYRSESLSKPHLSDLSKTSNVAPTDFSIVAKINITNDSNRSVVFCAATYVISDSGAIYFINETRGSLVDLLP